MNPANFAILKTSSDADQAEEAAAVPDCPPTLTGEARHEWARLTALLADRGLVADLDRGALAVYCRAWQRWTEAEARIEEMGAVVKSPNGYPVANPFLSVSAQAARQMQALLAEFGLSPKARRKLGGTRKQKAAP